MRRFRGIGMLLFMALFWTALTGALDCAVVYSLFKQVRSQGYPVAAGVIRSSTVTSRRGSKGGTSYTPVLVFNYNVAGQWYSGSKYAYGLWGGGSYEAADALVRAHPPGTPVQVHYNPADPADAVLRTGVQSMTMFIGLFTIPGNLAAFGLWAAAGGLVWRGVKRPPAGGLKIIETDGLTLLRVAWVSPLAVGLTVMGLASFLGTFVLAFTGGPGAPILLTGVVIACSAVLGAIGYLLAAFLGPRRAKYLTIDPALDKIILPRVGGKAAEQSIALGSLRDIRTHIVGKGKSQTTFIRFESEGEPATTDLRLSLLADRVDGLVEYLRQRCLKTP